MNDASVQVELPPRHQWQRITLGRVCHGCQVTQANDEFDDEVPCEAS